MDGPGVPHAPSDATWQQATRPASAAFWKDPGGGGAGEWPPGHVYTRRGLARNAYREEDPRTSPSDSAPFWRRRGRQAKQQKNGAGTRHGVDSLRGGGKLPPPRSRALSRPPSRLLGWSQGTAPPPSTQTYFSRQEKRGGNRYRSSAKRPPTPAHRLFSA